MTDWASEAACRGEDLEVFFGVENEYDTSKRHKPLMSPKDIQRAKGICASCPVLRPCLSYAVEMKFEYGVWGGMTSNERKALMPIDLENPRDDRRIGMSVKKPVPRPKKIKAALREQGGYVESLEAIPVTKSRTEEQSDTEYRRFSVTVDQVC